MATLFRIGLFCCFLPLWVLAGSSSASAEAHQGLVDLAGWKGANKLELMGEWIFFANELVTPEEYLKRTADPSFQAPLATIGQSFPEASKGQTPHQGYATYVLRLKNWPIGETLGFTGIQVYTAAQVYFFGADGQGAEQPIQTLGQVAAHEEQGAPQIRDDTIKAVRAVQPQDYFFLIQVSNYHHAWGGLWRAPEVATIAVLNAEEKLRERILYFIAGCLVFAAAYNFSLFSRRPEDKGSLILGFMALVLSLESARGLIPAPFLGSYNLAFEIHLRRLYMVMMLTPMLAAVFFRYYFPRFVPKLLHHALVMSLSSAALFFALAPVRLFSVLGTVGQVFGLGSGLLCALCVLRAWLARERGASLVLWGSLAVLIGAILDVVATKGVVQLPVNLMSIGLVIFIMTQSQIVAVHFAAAFRQAEHLSRELQSEVERQTRDIKSILDSIQQGIFTLVDDGATVGSQFSKHLKRIVRHESVTGSALNELLLKKSNLSGDAQSQALSALQSAMGEDVLVFETNAHCLPTEILFTPEDAEEARTLELEWTPMVDARDTVDKVLVCLRDVTDMRALQEKAQQHEEELRILQEILRIPEDRFQRFIQKTEAYLQQNRQLILNVKSQDRGDVIRNLFMNMHTIKGTARTYFLYAISAASHEVEQYYASLQKAETEWEPERLLKDLDRMASLVRYYDQVGREKLGWSATDKVLRLPRKRLLAGLDRLNALHHERLSAEGQRRLLETESILMESCYSPLQNILEDSCQGIDSLARDLQKPLPKISISPSQVILRDDGADVLHSIMIHLLRNSLDHGLESADVRMAAGKSPEGHIQISIEEQDSDLVLSFHDDGQGLDLPRIEALARERGLLPHQKSLSDDERAELIFLPGLSTKVETTEISGRGIGMDAVRSYLEKVGGRIGIHFMMEAPVHQHRPFRFEIQLPAELWWSPARHRVSMQQPRLGEPA